MDCHLWSSFFASCNLLTAVTALESSRALEWALGQHCGVWTVANKSFGVGTGAALCSVDSGKQVSITVYYYMVFIILCITNLGPRY